MSKMQDDAGVKVAVVGATGLIGGELLDILTAPERQFPYSDLHLLASENSAGQRISLQDQSYKVQDIAKFDFSQVDLVFFCAGSAVAKSYVMPAIEAGCWVIDQSSLFRYQEHIPLLIPEINGEILAYPRYQNARLIANPNCSTIQLLMAVYPIARHVGLKSLEVATYQAVSGAGQKAQEELLSQTVALLNLKDIPEPQSFAQQIAFNTIPQIDAWEENGFTREEMKVVWESQKILETMLEMSGVEINVTAVRVPVVTGHGEAVHIQTEEVVTTQQATEWLQAMPGLEVVTEPEVPTALQHAAGQDTVFVGRLRQRLGVTPGINMWVVADNLRKGGSLNAVQIAELLVKMGRFG